jgi:hypothetical protein
MEKVEEKVEKVEKMQKKWVLRHCADPVPSRPVMRGMPDKDKIEDVHFSTHGLRLTTPPRPSFMSSTSCAQRANISCPMGARRHAHLQPSALLAAVSSAS